MTNRLPPTEPLDDEEREFARILRALPGGDPPAALDAGILRSAANAAATARRPGARWLATGGALWGIGGAAAAVLALGVSWQLLAPMPPQPAGETTPAAAMADEARDDSVTVDFQDSAPAPAGALPEASPAMPPPPAPAAATATRPTPRRARAPVAPPSPPPPPPPMANAPEPFPEVLDEHVGAAAMAESESLAGAAASEARRESAAKAIAQGRALRAATAAQGTEAATAAMATDATAERDMAAPAELVPMTPAKWLARIRQLRDDGHLVEAKAELEAFRKRHPTRVVPSDLAPLLAD